METFSEEDKLLRSIVETIEDLEEEKSELKAIKKKKKTQQKKGDEAVLDYSMNRRSRKTPRPSEIQPRLTEILQESHLLVYPQNLSLPQHPRELEKQMMTKTICVSCWN